MAPRHCRDTIAGTGLDRIGQAFPSRFDNPLCGPAFHRNEFWGHSPIHHVISDKVARENEPISIACVASLYRPIVTVTLWHRLLFCS